MVDVDWIWLFVDAPAGAADAALSFWRAASATTPSPWRGVNREFTTLEPDGADAWVKFQRLGPRPDGDGDPRPARIHLDLDVADPPAASRTARRLGASTVAEHDDYVVLASPGGFVFCLTTTDRARQVSGRGEAASRVDQVCLDIPPDRHDVEVAFWTSLTGWELGRSTLRPEFHWLEAPSNHLVRVLLQRLEVATADRVTGHLDLSCRDRAATRAAHVQRGATPVADEEFWSVMRDPTGMDYCLTDRHPRTGRLEP